MLCIWGSSVSGSLFEGLTGASCMIKKTFYSPAISPQHKSWLWRALGESLIRTKTMLQVSMMFIIIEFCVQFCLGISLANHQDRAIVS